MPIQTVGYNKAIFVRSLLIQPEGKYPLLLNQDILFTKEHHTQVLSPMPATLTQNELQHRFDVFKT